MNFAIWLKEWLEIYIQPTRKESTYQKYKHIINKHIVPNLGNFGLHELSYRVLQNSIAYISTPSYGLSPSTINSIITIIQSSLKTAVKSGLVDFQYATLILRPKVLQKQVAVFSKEEQLKIEEYIRKKNDSKLIGIIISLYTGVRIGELLSLEWRDIDLQKGQIHITKTCHFKTLADGKYTQIITVPKTPSSVRAIPIPKFLKELLIKQKLSSSSLFVISHKGNPMKIRTYQKSFETLLYKLKIPHRNFHALRHTFATRAIESGMDVKTLSEILGHKNPVITLNIYTHSLWDYKRNAMENFAHYLGK